MPNLVTSGRTVAVRRILMALGVSLLLHSLVLSRFGMFSAKELARGARSLEVSLLASPALAPPLPSAAQAVSVPETAVPEQEVKVRRKNKPPLRIPDVAENPLATEPAAAAEVMSYAPPTPESADQSPGIPLPGLAGRVQRVAIEFELFSGADRKLIGTGQHVYVADDSGHYGVSVQQKINADYAAQGEPWALEISGIITRQGLSPILFHRQGAIPERLMALNEVPENSSVLPAGGRSGRIPDGILDRQSLLYQFMLQPPELTGGQLLLSDSATYRLFAYRLAGVESFTLPSLGEVRTIKLFLSASESSETIELWLVPDLHYLPVKVRHTDRLGVVTEQVAISLDFD